MVAREAHRLHHGFRARHVERHLVETGDLAQARHVVGERGVIGPEHGTQRGGTPRTFREAGLVELVAEQVHAVGPGQVIVAVAVEVGEDGTLAGCDERAHRQVAPHPVAELERHAVGGGELQIGQTRLDLGGELQRARIALPVQAREALEAATARICRGLWCPVGAEEGVLAVAVERDEPREAPGEAGMARDRRVLRPGQCEPAPERRQREQRGGAGQAAQQEGLVHGAFMYAPRLTRR